MCHQIAAFQIDVLFEPIVFVTPCRYYFIERVGWEALLWNSASSTPKRSLTIHSFWLTWLLGSRNWTPDLLMAKIQSPSSFASLKLFKIKSEKNSLIVEFEWLNRYFILWHGKTLSRTIAKLGVALETNFFECFSRLRIFISKKRYPKTSPSLLSHSNSRTGAVSNGCCASTAVASNHSVPVQFWANAILFLS